MTLNDANECVRQAKALIPRNGLGRDMHLVLDDVLNMTTGEALRDIERVRKACIPLPWDWAQLAANLLGRAADYFRDPQDPQKEQSSDD